MKQNLHMKTLDMMQQFGVELGQMLEGQTTILMRGELGAGKTTLSQAIAKGLGVSERVSSPTFTIVKEYESGRLPLYHIDAYRLEHGDDIGIDEYFHLPGVTIVEWPSMIEESLPMKWISIHIQYAQDGRDVEIETTDERYFECVATITKHSEVKENETVND